MIMDYRYLHAKDKFLDFSYLALQDQFSSRDEFISFFDNLKNDEQRNLFLKTASFYLFLVKKGDWLVDILGSNEKVDYLTDTYKYIAVFSLIESLRGNEFIRFPAEDPGCEPGDECQNLN